MSSKITDVAHMADVSIATVSNVINGTRPVRPETRRRVMEAIKTLEYVPDSTARHFKMGRKNSIGFIVPDISNIFFSTLIDSIEEILESNGYHLIIANTHENTAREAEKLRVLCAGTVGALIIASSFERYQELASHIPPDFPFVLMDRIPIDSRCDTIRADSSAAIEEGIGYLVARGHRKIGMLAWKENLSTTRDRVAAYKHSTEKRHLTPLVKYIDIDSEASYAAEYLLSENCTALLICNSKLYIDLMHFLSTTASRPEVVCFCDAPEYEHIFGDIPLIKQPAQEMGRLSGRIVLERLQSPDLRIKEAILRGVFQRPKQ